MIEFQPFRFFEQDNAKAGNADHIHSVNSHNAGRNEPKLMFPFARIGNDEADE